MIPMQARMSLMRRGDSIVRLQVQQVRPQGERPLEKDPGETPGQEKLFSCWLVGFKINLCVLFAYLLRFVDLTNNILTASADIESKDFS